MKRIYIVFLFLALSSVALAQGSSGDTAMMGTKVPCQIATLTGVNIGCYGLSTGSATVTINQPGTYRVIWSTGLIINSTTTLVHSITNLAAGYYDVQVINLSNGCSAFDIINITQPPKLTASVTTTDVKCFGQSTGIVDLTVGGGTAGFTYSWSNGSTSQDLTNVASGVYVVTVTDAKSCKASDTGIIYQPAQALGQSHTEKNPNCFGSADSWIDLTVWGGTTPYTYNWNGGFAVSQDLNNIVAGNYSVVITDANSCTAGMSVTLTNPPVLALSSTSTSNLCFGDVNGTVNLTTTGGTSPYTYSWANSTYLLSWDTEDLADLGSDTYYVTVTDANGCQRFDSAKITSPTQIISSITSTNVTTFGGINGAINLNVSGGVLPYGFLWSNGLTTQNLSGIPAGWYHVVITDANNCTREDSVYISEPLTPLGADLESVHVSCFGGSNGSMKVTATGGTPPYSYLWSNGNTSTQIGDINAGYYSITVTDFYNNTFVTGDTIHQPDAIAFSQIVTNVSCNGLPDGAINVSVTGGTPSYTYRWLNSEYVLAALTEDISGMPADQYYLEVTDTLGCMGSVSVTITQPAVLNIEMEHTNAYCAGGATGTGNAIISGGTLPYTYAWSNGASSTAISGLAAGVYTITVTDDHSCFVIDSIKITQTDSVRVDFTMEPVSCIDQHDGKLTAYAHGGNGDYSYAWSNGSTISTIENLMSGPYQITVTDLMGCSGKGEATVTKIEIECINIPTCFTPNEDGLNDIWVIKDADLYPEFSLKIYNRWGQIVYDLDGNYVPWDGMYKGNPLPAETYYYFLQLSAQTPVVQGNITIVR